MILKQGASCPRKTFTDYRLCRTQGDLGDPERQEIQIYPGQILFYYHVDKDFLIDLQ